MWYTKRALEADGGTYWFREGIQRVMTRDESAGKIEKDSEMECLKLRGLGETE